MAELEFGNPASIRARDEALAGKPIERMYASFGSHRRGLCEQCAHYETWEHGGRPAHCCSIYRRTHGLVRTWPGLAYACGRFEATEVTK